MSDLSPYLMYCSFVHSNNKEIASKAIQQVPNQPKENEIASIKSNLFRNSLQEIFSSVIRWNSVNFTNKGINILSATQAKYLQGK
jgi:hypothetical protein